MCSQAVAMATILAPNANVNIDSLSAEGFTANTCGELAGGVNEARCGATVGEQDAVVDCVFGR